jgi:hypothetical protein
MLYAVINDIKRMIINTEFVIREEKLEFIFLCSKVLRNGIFHYILGTKYHMYSKIYLMSIKFRLWG